MTPPTRAPGEYRLFTTSITSTLMGNQNQMGLFSPVQ